MSFPSKLCGSQNLLCNLGEDLWQLSTPGGGNSGEGGDNLWSGIMRSIVLRQLLRRSRFPKISRKAGTHLLYIQSPSVAPIDTLECINSHCKASLSSTGSLSLPLDGAEYKRISRVRWKSPTVGARLSQARLHSHRLPRGPYDEVHLKH